MKYRTVLYAFDSIDHRWTMDFEAASDRAARRHATKYANARGWCLYCDPEQITGSADLPVIPRLRLIAS